MFPRWPRIHRSGLVGEIYTPTIMHFKNLQTPYIIRNVGIVYPFLLKPMDYINKKYPLF